MTKPLAAAILTATSWVLWAFALIPIRMSGLHLGGFGLAANLPPIFYVACVTLSLAFILNLETPGEGRWRDLLFVCQIGLLIAFLFVTPALIETFPRFRTTYKVVGLTDLVTSTSAINPVVSPLFNWPSGWALFSGAFQVAVPSSATQTAFVKYYAPLMEVAYGVALYVLYRTFLSKKQAYLGIFLFYVINYVGQDYLSPQSVAYLLFLAFLGITFVYVIRAPSQAIRYPSVAVASLLFVIFLSLVVTHFLTSFALLMFFIVLALSARIVAKVQLDRFVVPYVVGFAGWMIFGSAAYFNSMLNRKAATLISESLALQTGVTGAAGNQTGSVGSVTHSFIANVGIVFALVTAAIAGIWFLYRYASTRRLDKTDAAFLALLVGLTPILVLPGYDGELLFRGFLLALPVLIYYLVKNVSFRVVKVAAVVLLLAGPMAHVLVAYGNESFNYVSPSEMSSYNFFYKTVSNASVYGGYPVASYLNEQNYRTGDLLQIISLLDRGPLNDSVRMQLVQGGPSYIFFTPGDSATIQTLYAPRLNDYLRAQNTTANAPYFNLIYSSADISLYQVRPS